MKSGLQAYRDMSGANKTALSRGGDRRGLAATAERLASYGTNGDDRIAHVTTDEIIVPMSVQKNNPDLMKGLGLAFADLGMDMDAYRVGAPEGNDNEKTGIEAFYDDGSGDESGGTSGGQGDQSESNAGGQNDASSSADGPGDVGGADGSDPGSESGVSDAVGRAVGRALGTNGFAGTGYGFGGFGSTVGAITGLGELAGEIGRDMGFDVSTPTDAVADDPSTDRNEGNDPSAFGGGDQGNDGGPGSERMVAEVETEEDSGGTGEQRPWTPSDWNEDAFLRTNPAVARAVASGTWDSGYEFNDAWKKFSGQDYGTNPITPRARNAETYRQEFINTPPGQSMPYRGYSA